MPDTGGCRPLPPAKGRSKAGSTRANRSVVQAVVRPAWGIPRDQWYRHIASGGQWPLMRSRSVRATSPGSGSTASSLARRRPVSPSKAAPAPGALRHELRPSYTSGSIVTPAPRRARSQPLTKLSAPWGSTTWGRRAPASRTSCPSPRDGRRRSTGEAPPPAGCSAPPWRWQAPARAPAGSLSEPTVTTTSRSSSARPARAVRNTSVFPNIVPSVRYTQGGSLCAGALAATAWTHGQGLAGWDRLLLERGRGDLDRDPPVQPAVAGGRAVERTPDRRHGVIGQRHHLVGEHWADQVVNTGDTQDLGGQRPGESDVSNSTRSGPSSLPMATTSSIMSGAATSANRRGRSSD